MVKGSAYIRCSLVGRRRTYIFLYSGLFVLGRNGVVPGGDELRGVLFALIVTFIVICAVMYCGVTVSGNKVAGRIFLLTFRRVPVV